MVNGLCGGWRADGDDGTFWEVKGSLMVRHLRRLETNRANTKNDARLVLAVSPITRAEHLAAVDWRKAYCAPADW